MNFQKALGNVNADEKHIKDECIVYIDPKNNMFHTPDALHQIRNQPLHHIKVKKLKITDKSGNIYLPDTINNLYLKYKLISFTFDVMAKNKISKIQHKNIYTRRHLLINHGKYTLTWTKQPLAIVTFLTSVIIWNLYYRLNTV